MSSEQPVDIAEYDARWAQRFNDERLLLEETIGPWLNGSIEHVGSTAVPGLAAKPVIDIMAGVHDLAASRPALAALATIGYQYFPYRPDVMHWLCKPSPQMRTHHLHLVPFESPLWFERLAFRDHLRIHADTARDYETLKRRLAGEHHFDREAYTEAKSAFIQDVLRRVAESNRDTR